MISEDERASQTTRGSQSATARGAVFVSYASEDAGAAERIASALRAAGIEVWFDKSELRGGEAWDRQIRKQVHDCALFVPIISAQSDSRYEGYFRREWRLAVERSGDMAEDVPFLLPVVIDATKDATARVPDRFREVQWAHLPDGEVSRGFIERLERLLSPAERQGTSATPRAGGPIPAATGIAQPRAAWVSKRALIVAAAVALAGAIAYRAVDKLTISRHPALRPAPPAVAAANTGATFAPPAHSIAVLPFVNMSGDKEQEYFSDGLTEELLNSLARINELQVAARTSAFSFKGKDTDIGTIARKLNVATVLEGSVRRAGNTVRVTAQLNSALTGYHLWSQTYDRGLGDVLKLETEIATAVAEALRVTLLADETSKIVLGGTRNPAAFDAYLRACKDALNAQDENGFRDAIAAYTEAIDLDPDYTLALAGRALALLEYAENVPSADILPKAQIDARRAIALTPELAEGYLASARFHIETLDVVSANDELVRALALAPGNPRVLLAYGVFESRLGRADAAIDAIRRAVVLDPVNPRTQRALASVLRDSRRYPEAISAYQKALALDPTGVAVYLGSGMLYYMLSDFERARSLCEPRRDHWRGQMCLALVYEKLGRHSDAQSMLAKVRARFGDSGAYGYTYTYAQWGDIPEALKWLETAYRLHDNDLLAIQGDPLMDPLRKEPRFQAIVRALKLPERAL
jgi:TolB-like protein/Flp pilus assembly protein TadD